MVKAQLGDDHDRTGTMHLLDNNGQELADPCDAYYQENFWIWDLAYSEYFSDSEPTAIGIRENGVVAPFSLMNPTFINYDMGRYGVSFLVGIASGGYEKITYKDWYGYDAEADSELFYMVDETGSIWRCNMFVESDTWDMIIAEYPSDLSIRFPVGFDGRSSLVVGEDNALYLSAFTGKTSEVYRLVFDESADRYVSTSLGSFGKDVWPAVILDASSNAPEAQVAPQGTVRYNTVPEGMLDAVSAGDLSAYTDADKILPFAVEAWSWAVSNGIVTGMTADTLAPMNLTNRAQAAIIFQRFDRTFA